MYLFLNTIIEVVLLSIFIIYQEHSTVLVLDIHLIFVVLTICNVEESCSFSIAKILRFFNE